MLQSRSTFNSQVTAIGRVTFKHYSSYLVSNHQVFSEIVSSVLHSGTPLTDGRFHSDYVHLLKTMLAAPFFVTLSHLSLIQSILMGRLALIQVIIRPSQYWDLVYHRGQFVSRHRQIAGRRPWYQEKTHTGRERTCKPVRVYMEQTQDFHAVR